ncbi:MAG: hypothetical protein Q7J82_06725 [Coriobacteriia bacterium]|nr:hypothetical protein [Coriobacteriia bacterium]
MTRRAPTLLRAIELEETARAAETARAERGAARKAAKKRFRKHPVVRAGGAVGWWLGTLAATLVAIVVLNLVFNPDSEFSRQVVGFFESLRNGGLW